VAEIDFEKHCPACASCDIGDPNSGYYNAGFFLTCFDCQLLAQPQLFRQLQELRSREAKLAKRAGIPYANADARGPSPESIQGLSDWTAADNYRTSCIAALAALKASGNG
jgi:hypothetical protein